MRTLALLLPLTLGFGLMGCHHNAVGDEDGGLADSGGDLAGGDLAQPPISSFDGGSSDMDELFDVEPSSLVTIQVASGQPIPTTVFQATLGGSPVSAAWGVDRGDIASATSGPASSTTVTPTGTTGGLLTLTAGFNGKMVTRQVFVKVTSTQNGVDSNNPDEAAQVPSNVGQLTAGGGVGGVGGEGLGPAVTDPSTVTALGTPTGDATAQGLTLLYPYDATVFPRGMLAPLLMWRWTPGDADAIQIELSTTSGSYSWKGTFGRPTILTQTGGKYVRAPIPQDVWKAATNTAGGPTPSGGTDQLVVKLTVAKSGVGYGPLTQTWRIAAAHLSGIIYYQSYGTNLVQDTDQTAAAGGHFGAGTLSIHVGDTGPKLTASSNGPDANCRVCHSVSADGSRLIAQWGNNGDAKTSQYALSPTNTTETPMTNNITFAGLSPDGNLALTQDGKLVDVAADTVLNGSAVSAVANNLGPAAFAPKGTSVSFNPMDGTLGSPKQKLVTMSYDPMAKTFSNPVTVVDYSTASSTKSRPGWPSFLPDSKSIVFHHQLGVTSESDDAGGDSSALNTRRGVTAQVEWTSTTDATHVTALNQLNGLDAAGNSYLPTYPNAPALSCSADGKAVGGIDPTHATDPQLNYEPTVNPVPSGGYAWIVFTSRRLYGNEATIPPFCSDPRGVDLIHNITPKKLWVAAIDLNAAPGTDVSHPAFYLPAQELLAGNARAFWVLDPCRADGTSCETGDQCCGGYCEPTGAGGANVCSNTIPNNSCAMEQEKCNSAVDCCNASDSCTNGFCTISNPPIL